MTDIQAHMQTCVRPVADCRACSDWFALMPYEPGPDPILVALERRAIAEAERKCDERQRTRHHDPAALGPDHIGRCRLLGPDRLGDHPMTFPPPKPKRGE